MSSSSTACGVNNSITFGSDPNNASSISASATHGAINVSWNYPTTNPHSVAHIVLRRASSNSFGASSVLAVLNTNGYRDPMSEGNSGTTFYYWIQVKSINGTTLATVGPAQATAGSFASQTLALIAGQINESALNAALRTQIADIALLRSDLIDENTGRLAAITTIEGLLNGLGLDVTNSFAEIATERTTRINGQNALASQISAVAVSNGQNVAAIVTEQTARITADTAEATARQLLGVQVADNGAAITAESTARANADSALANDISTVQALTATNLAAIQTETTARTDADSALANQVTQVEASVVVAENDIDALENDVNAVPTLISAAVQEYDTAQVGYCLIGGQISAATNRDTKTECENAGGTWLPLRALAQAVKTVQINDGNGSATVEQKAIAYRNSLDTLNAEYTVKVQTTNNGEQIVGGFGIATDSGAGTVDAGFDVDRFWVGKITGNPDKANPNIYPFAIINDQVFIKSATIAELSVGTLKLAGESVTVSSVDAFDYAHVNIYKNTSQTTGQWRYKTTPITSDTDQILAENPSGGGVVIGNFIPSGGVSIGGISGEFYEVDIQVTMDLGIKGRPNSTAYLSKINMNLELFLNGNLHSTEFLGVVRKRINTFDSTPESNTQIFSCRVLLPGNNNLTYRIKAITGFYIIDALFGPTFTPAGTVLHYVWMQDIVYKATVYKR